MRVLSRLRVRREPLTAFLRAAAEPVVIITEPGQADLLDARPAPATLVDALSRAPQPAMRS